jgi:hypothetical protein
MREFGGDGSPINKFHRKISGEEINPSGLQNLRGF